MRKALISACIASFGVLVTNVGIWLDSGHLDTKILVATLTSALSSFLIAFGRILAQQENATKPQ